MSRQYQRGEGQVGHFSWASIFKKPQGVLEMLQNALKGLEIIYQIDEDFVNGSGHARPLERPAYEFKYRVAY